MNTYTVEVEKGGFYFWASVKFRGSLIVSFSKTRAQALPNLARVLIQYHDPKRSFALITAKRAQKSYKVKRKILFL